MWRGKCFPEQPGGKAKGDGENTMGKFIDRAGIVP